MNRALLGKNCRGELLVGRRGKEVGARLVVDAMGAMPTALRGHGTRRAKE
jgi:hypothetical protein